jgi:hypothetical protein
MYYGTAEDYTLTDDISTEGFTCPGCHGKGPWRTYRQTFSDWPGDHACECLSCGCVGILDEFCEWVPSPHGGEEVLTRLGTPRDGACLREWITELHRLGQTAAEIGHTLTRVGFETPRSRKPYQRLQIQQLLRKYELTTPPKRKR